MTLSDIAATVTGERMMTTYTGGRERPSPGEIARLACHLYEMHGRRDGHDVDDWLTHTAPARGPTRDTGTQSTAKEDETMRIVVIGGTGPIGSRLVTKLRDHGHEAVAAPLDSGVNTLAGEGLAEALSAADVVIDVSNSPSFEDAAVLNFFQTATRNLLAAEAVAGVRHHVALSVVGTERLSESGYFGAKTTQEELIKAGYRRGPARQRRR